MQELKTSRRVILTARALDRGNELQVTVFVDPENVDGFDLNSSIQPYLLPFKVKSLGTILAVGPYLWYL